MVISLFALLSIASTDVFSDSFAQTDWKSIRTDYATYIKQPNKTNATALLALLPNQYISFENIGDEERQTLDYLSDWNRLKKIQYRIAAGDFYALRVAFHLRAIADGAFSEDLDVITGKGIENHPELFLRELRSAVPPVNAVSLRSLVSNLGDGFVDKQAEQCQELFARERAISGVKVPNLTDYQKRVIDALHDQEDQICRPAGD